MKEPSPKLTLSFRTTERQKREALLHQIDCLKEGSRGTTSADIVVQAVEYAHQQWLADRGVHHDVPADDAPPRLWMRDPKTLDSISLLVAIGSLTEDLQLFFGRLTPQQVAENHDLLAPIAKGITQVTSKREAV